MINIDLCGILYPKNFFQNSTFYDNELYLKSSNNSEDFCQSVFIIVEDKNLRQSSKILDYTKYLINDKSIKEIYISSQYLLQSLLNNDIFHIYHPSYSNSL